MWAYFQLDMTYWHIHLHNHKAYKYIAIVFQSCIRPKKLTYWHFRALKYSLGCNAVLEYALLQIYFEILHQIVVKQGHFASMVRIWFESHFFTQEIEYAVYTKSILASHRCSKMSKYVKNAINVYIIDIVL